MPNKLPPPVSAEQSPLALVNEVGKGFHDRMRRAMDRAGIPCGYRALLFHLSHSDGCTQLELTRLTHLTAPTVSVALQKMEHDGYVTRCTDAADLRQIRVFLTEKGKQTEMANRERAEALDRVSLEGFTDAEKETLRAMLIRMRDNLFSSEDGETPKEDDTP